MIDKTAIYNEAKQLLADWYPGAGIGARGDCLYWTQAGMNILLKHGKRPVLQAGDMLWPCAVDTGSNNTHFGYEWSPHCPFSMEKVRQGLLPEVHIWIALPDDGELIDFSTGYFKKIATENGLEWNLPDPPLFVWGVPPSNTRYRPHIPAIDFVWRFIICNCIDREEITKHIANL